MPDLPPIPTDELFGDEVGTKVTEASKPKHIVAGLAFALLAGLITLPVVVGVLSAAEWLFGRAGGTAVGLSVLGYLALQCVPAYINAVHEKLGIAVRV